MKGHTMRAPFVLRLAIATLWLALLLVAAVSAQVADFGQPLPGLTPQELAQFEAGLAAFLAEETIETGLGPVFNGASCAGCHDNPVVGGDSRARVTRFGTASGKKFDPLLSGGGSLIQRNGIGQIDDCHYVGESIPPEANVIATRKTTPLFGMGLVEAIPDSAIKQGAAKQPQAIKGVFHQVQDRVQGPGASIRVGRFGQKAQAATVLQFSADAFLNEAGITSAKLNEENCPNGDCDLLRCDPTMDPEDQGQVHAVANYMTLLAAPPRGEITPQVDAGEAIFQQLGCAACHVPTWVAGSSPIAAISGQTFHPYSDFLLHDMGAGGDGIAQGKAKGSQMRTAPLWGLRTRARLMAEGDAETMQDAILMHQGQGAAAKAAFEALSPEDVAALLAFLGSL